MYFSIQVTESQASTDRHAVKGKKNIADISALVWHTLSTNDVCTRLGVAPKVGLDTEMAARRLATNGKNVISPPPRNLTKKVPVLLQCKRALCLLTARPNRYFSTSSEVRHRLLGDARSPPH